LRLHYTLLCREFSWRNCSEIPFACCMMPAYGVVLLTHQVAPYFTKPNKLCIHCH
jgi:hypothetical protein